MRRRTSAAVFGVAVLGVVGVTGYFVLHHVGPLFQPQACTGTVGGHTVSLSIEQAENAALISGVAVQRGMPARAASIALATAFQESKLYNVEEGDRDSLGLFQQRPSQGWGTRAQILNPYYATNSFYNALDRIDGYETMRITEAAQEVQRSGYPEAYADHEADARTLASALTGNSPHAFTCTVSGDAPKEKDKLNGLGLTHRADAVRREVNAVFGQQSLGGFEPGGASDAAQGSAHAEGRAIDVYERPVNGNTRVRGWAIAQYLVAQADRLAIQTVIFDDKIWKATDSKSGWEDYQPPNGASDPASEARDRVHVDVFD